MTSKIFSVATFIVVSWLAVTVLTTSKRVNILEARLIDGMTSSVSAMDARISAMENNQLENHHSILAKLEKQQTMPLPAPQPMPVPAAAVPMPVVAEQDLEAMNELESRVADLQQQLASHTEFGELKKAYNDVIESELEKYNNPEEAAEMLLSTKGVIWKTGIENPDLQQSLQGLMAPIDITASRWKSGDTEGTVRPIYKVLKQTLISLNAKS